MKRILLILFILPLFAQAQSWQWAKRSSSSGSGWGNSVITDPSGNVFVTGTNTNATITFGTTTITGAFVYLVKYDASGNALWASGASGNGFSTSVRTDAAGNVYITGGFQSRTLTFGTTILTNSDTTGTSHDIFLAKYSSAGTLVWARSVGNIGIDIAYSETVDASGNVYIAGEMGSTSLTFGTTTLTNIGASGYNAFLAKYSPSGSVIWAKNAGGTGGGVEASSVHADAFGHVFLAGCYQSLSITFGSMTLTHTTTSGEPYNGFLVKYDVAGNVLWARSEDGGNWGNSWLVASDASDNIYVTGYFSLPTITIGTTTLSHIGQADMDIVKYDSAGTVLWAKSAGGVNVDGASELVCDAFGNIYVVGTYNSPTMTFGTTTITNSGSQSGFFVEYDPLGNVVFATDIGGTGIDAASSVAYSSACKIYVAGWFASPTVTFGSTILTNDTSGKNQMFLANWTCQKEAAPVISYNRIDINIYPNPAASELIVSASDKISSLTITNLIGQTVYTHEYNSSQVQVDVAGLPKGMYLVRINGSEVKKFIKE